jgi:pyruvate dehydrogenase kinase 2/3/4
MQRLPYKVVTNSHISHVYALYYKAFEKFRRVSEITSLEDNDKYCKIIQEMLQEHLTIIPRLAMGVLEVQGQMAPEETDKFMITLLRSRISRRVIAEQHLALTETFHSPWHFPDAKTPIDPNAESVGEIFLRCNAKDIVEQCAKTTQELIRQSYGRKVNIPEVNVEGHLGATFPYILSHLEYIVGELLRNSIQATIEQPKYRDISPPPIQVLICETNQHVIIRISDQGGGIPREILPHLWSFSKGPRRGERLHNLHRVPKMAATLQEVKVGSNDFHVNEGGQNDLTSTFSNPHHRSSLSSLTSRPPQLRLGIGLPMSRIYAEYWAGSLELHSLEGYGTDCFLQISKLGNKNETLSTRATMDAV